MTLSQRQVINLYTGSCCRHARHPAGLATDGQHQEIPRDLPMLDLAYDNEPLCGVTPRGAACL